MSHPVHPALVHFPIACWSLATLADLASMFGSGSAWSEPAWLLAGWLLVIGLAAALAAMAAGMVELLKLDDDHPAFARVNHHMWLAMTAWALYAASLFLRLDDMTLTRPSGLAIALSVAGFIALGMTGWLGGTLVYGYGVGVSRRR